jgi:enoyl-CoA hydratase/carnithine racemase
LKTKELTLRLVEIGLVDYVAKEGTTAFNRAVELGTQIATNAPLALRAAKQAISRAPELSLEPGSSKIQFIYAIFDIQFRSRF